MNSNAGSVTVSTPSARLPAPNCATSLMLPDFDRADRIGEFWGTRRRGRSPSC